MRYLQSDGSYQGFLTAIFDATAMRPHPDGIYIREPEQTDLLVSVTPVRADAVKADRVLTGIRAKLGVETESIVETAFAYGLSDMGGAIFRYLQFGWRIGKELNDHLTHEDVWNVIKASRRVSGETHMYLGVTRFRQTEEGVYYAPISPESHILPLLCPHFLDRFPTHACAIHDTAHNRIALLYNGEFQVRDTPEGFVSPDGNAYDGLIADLWRAFFTSIAIESRINPKLQRNNMPKKYWKHMTEMNAGVRDK